MPRTEPRLRAVTARLWARVLIAALGVLMAAGAAVQAEPRDVRVGVFITSLSGLDPADASFRVTAYLWTTDPDGTFDPETDLEVLGRQFSIRRLTSMLLPDGRFYTAVLIDAVVDQRFDVRAYPYDSQTLTVQLESTSDITQLRLMPDASESRLADFLQMPGWEATGLRFEAGEHTYDTGFGHRTVRPTFSRLSVLVDVERNRSPLVFEKFAGFLVAMIITALVFAVPVEELGTRLGMMTSSVFAAVFNRYRLEDAIGYNSVFGLVDQVSLLTFSAILTALALSLWAYRMRGVRTTAEIVRLDHRAGLGAITLHALLLALAFAMAMR